MAIHYSRRETDLRAAELHEAYRTHRGAIAYLDETFSLQDAGTRFYAVTASVVRWEDRDLCRRALLAVYDDDPVHASELYGRAQAASLELAVRAVARQQAMHCIVVRTAVAENDRRGDEVRIACLRHLVTALSGGRTRTTLYVVDSRGNPVADRVDADAIRQLRVDGAVPRSVTLLHRRPSEEPLIGLADVVGWTWRQEWLGTSQQALFAPLRGKVIVRSI